MTSSKPVPTNHRKASLIVALALICVAACAETTTDAAEGKPATTSDQSAPARAREVSDRGNARFTAAGTTWLGTRASVRQATNRLRISASKTARIGDTMQRDQLNLNISAYKGPGHYKADMLSMFVRVSIDLPRDQAEQADAQKTLIDALGNTSKIRLVNADIEITSVSAGYIDGTFAIDRPAGAPESTISDGQFHARVRD